MYRLYLEKEVPVYNEWNYPLSLWSLYGQIAILFGKQTSLGIVPEVRNLPAKRKTKPNERFFS
ncbi:hypothetical protein CE91St19_07940 [Odoribacter laneus]|jgi:hypothetical protein|nr:hypothetical protein CE91St19_07940 [Odoribacter laneus]GKI25974.1 hypothetical protein CE91St20_21110 [Odoribacter laneus]